MIWRCGSLTTKELGGSSEGFSSQSSYLGSTKSRQQSAGISHSFLIQAKVGWIGAEEEAIFEITRRNGIGRRKLRDIG